MTDLQILPKPKSVKFSKKSLKLKKKISSKLLKSLEKNISDVPKRTEKICASVGLKLRLFEVVDFEPQAYKIEIGTGGIIICAGDKTGLCFGYQTLLQIISQCEKAIPCCIIEDSPSNDLRAFYLDLRIHKFRHSYIKHIFKELARLKYNAVIINYEDTFLFKNEPLVTGSIYFRKEQISELNKAASEYGIKLIPYQQILGNLCYILSLERYSSLASKKTGVFDPKNAKAEKLLKSLINELCNSHDSDYVFLGGNEDDIYLENFSEEDVVKYFKAIVGSLSKNKKLPMVWSSTLESFPAIIELLPENSIVAVTEKSSKTATSKLIKQFQSKNLKTLIVSCGLDSPDNEFARDIPRCLTNIAKSIETAESTKSFGTIFVSKPSDGTAFLFPRNGISPIKMHGSRRMHLETSWFLISMFAEAAWNNEVIDEKLFLKKWAGYWFGKDDIRLSEIQLMQCKHFHQGAELSEIVSDRKKVIKLVGGVAAEKRSEQLSFLDFYAKLAIHAIHVKQIFSHTPKKQEVSLLKTEISRLKEMHKTIMKASLFNKEVAEEQNHLFGHAEHLLSRITRKK